MKVELHPSVENAVKAGSGSTLGTLFWKSAAKAVPMSVNHDQLCNDVCGCSQRWRRVGALLPMIAVAPTDKVNVIANGRKVRVVERSKTIQRGAGASCRAYMHGPISAFKHALNALTIIHAECFNTFGWSAIYFGAFVSALLEAGNGEFRRHGWHSRASKNTKSGIK